MVYKFYDIDSNILELMHTSDKNLMLIVNDHSQPETILKFTEEELYEIIGCLLNIQKKIKNV